MLNLHSFQIAQSTTPFIQTSTHFSLSTLRNHIFSKISEFLCGQVLTNTLLIPQQIITDFGPVQFTPKRDYSDPRLVVVDNVLWLENGINYDVVNYLQTRQGSFSDMRFGTQLVNYDYLKSFEVGDLINLETPELDVAYSDSKGTKYIAYYSGTSEHKDEFQTRETLEKFTQQHGGTTGIFLGFTNPSHTNRLLAEILIGNSKIWIPVVLPSPVEL